MKIDIRSIVRDHVKTLYDAHTGRLSKLDLVIFYAIPLVTSVMAYASDFALRTDAYNVSITFFGIFVALFLNIQVATFGILQRRWDKPTDVRLAQLQSETLADRRTLLTEINANLSYIVLVCCVALFSSLLFYIRDWRQGAAPCLLVFLYLHFLLTLIMIVKRAHALFHKEYQASGEE
jgi:hypothetical protein